MSVDMILGLVFVGVGFLFIGLAVFFLIRTRNFINNSEKTQGQVILNLYQADSEGGGGGYTPVFEFRTAQGKKVEGSGDLAVNPPQYKVGQTVEVLYDPKKPEEARINKGLNLYYIPGFLAFFGLVFGVMGFFFLIK